MNETTRGCGICDVRDSRVLHRMEFSMPIESPLPDRYDIVACAGCGFVYADTPAAQQDYDVHYTDFSRYEDAAVASGGGDAGYDALRLSAAGSWLASQLSATASIADVGCGNGGLLDALSELGFSKLTKLTGIELAPGCLANLREKGYIARGGSIRRLPVDLSGSFDVVLLSHVMEHVVDLKDSLTSARSLLKPGGLVYIETPDASRYAGLSLVPFYFFDPEHINHFDVNSLTNLCGSVGLSVVNSGQRDFALPSGQPYPATFVLAHFDGRISTIQREDSLEEAVRTYITESHDRDFAPGLEALQASGRPIVMWGAGSEAQRILQRMGDAHGRLVAVVDRDATKHGRVLYGCTITTPEVGLVGVPTDAVLLIAAALVAPAIREEFLSMGVPLPVVLPWEPVENAL